jgi:hypothetical protein
MPNGMAQRRAGRRDLRGSSSHYHAACLRAAQAARPLQPVLGLLAASKFDQINEGSRVDNFQAVICCVSGVE